MARTHYDPHAIPVPRPHDRSTDGRRPWTPVRGPLGELDVAALRHPAEPSRLALALIAMSFALAVALFVLISLGEVTRLVLIAVGIVLALFVIWAAIQIWRIRLLGDAVLVSAQTLPEVQEIVDVVRARLGYDRRIDLFVVDKVSRVLSGDAAPIGLTSFFGVRVLVAEGEALGDLSDDHDRQHLLFTLATYVGALKDRYESAWSPIVTAFQMTGLAKLVWPFVYPYYRTTVYSGDRIAYACCGDLDVSLQAVYRSLVGPDVAEHVRADGLLGQALQARRRLLLRVAQLLRPTPHATSRYLQLLAFVRERTPEAFDAHRPPLAGAGAEVEPVLTRIGRQRPHPSTVAVALGLAVALLVGGVFLGLEVRESVVAQTIADAFDEGTDDDQDDVVTPPPPVPSSPVDEDAQMLLEFLPSSMWDSCTATTADATAQELAAVSCSLGGTHPDELHLTAYASSVAMAATLDELAGDVPRGSCEYGDARGTWTYDDVPQGPIACYESVSGHTTIVWGSDTWAVMALARDTTWSPASLYQWWSSEAAAYLQ